MVHSAWLGAWQWGHVTPELEKTGATVIAPDLPGHGADKTAPKDISMQNYVDSLVALLDQQKESVILVGHSFNGITISRVAELCPDKVAKLVYISAFLLPNGGSFFKAVEGIEGSKVMENFYLSEDKTFALVNEEEIQNAFAHDISKEVFAEAAANIVPEPAAPLAYELEISDTHYGQIPKYYIECTEDRAIPIAVQRAMYKDQVKESYSLASSHTPNFSQPGKLFSILLQIEED